jgi:hypothetical protein
MPLRLPRVVKAAALMFIGAIAAGWPTGDTVAHAENAARKQAIQYPWTGTDDEILVNLAIGNLRDSMTKWLTTERGVHAETLLVSIGAIAGFAAQCAVDERIRKRDVPGADKAMPGPEFSKYLHDRGFAVVVTAKSGETYQFGDLINGYLVNQSTTVNYHLFGILAAAAVEMGAKYEELPDYIPMFKHASKTIGTPEYGILHPPENLDPHYTPRQALEILWPHVKFLFERKGPQFDSVAKGRSVPVEYWPLVTALVARQFLLWSKGTIDPRISVGLMMESAIVMSKVDPKTVRQDRPKDVPPQPPRK